MWSESHSRPAPSWPPALTPKREIFTWTCYGHTSLMTKRCENPANSQQPTQSPLHSGFSRTHLYREKERGRAASSVRLILSETFSPNLRSGMDREEKSSFPTEQKGPILPPQTLSCGSVQSQLSFELCHAKTIALEWSSNSLSPRRLLMANIKPLATTGPPAMCYSLKRSPSLNILNCE